MSKVHSWMRLLLWYHCPELAKHLDNVRLGWEIPAKQITLKEAIILHTNYYLLLLYLTNYTSM
jgi:hypothetical protein